jgi:hypothetical protein
MFQFREGKMKKIFLSLLMIIASASFAIAAIPTASPSVSILSMAIAGTQYPLTFEAGVTAWTLYGRGLGDVSFSYAAGGVTTNTRMTIPAGGRYDESGKSLTSKLTIYLSSTVTNEEVEVLTWK